MADELEAGAQHATPKVSVVLPTHDRASTLEAAALSVLEQTVTDLELIIIDDASTDGSAAVIARLLSDPRVRVIRHPTNLGAGAARNSGLAEARGEFVAFQDSDDLWQPGALDTTLTHLSRQPASTGVCFGYTAKRGRLGATRIPTGWAQQRDGDFLRPLAEGNFIGLPATLTRRAVLREVGGFDPDLPTLEDWDLWLRVAAVTGFSFVPVTLVVSPTTTGGTNRFSSGTLDALERIERKHAALFEGNPAARAQLAYLRGVACASIGDRADMQRNLVAAAALSPEPKYRLAAAASPLGAGAVLASLALAKRAGGLLRDPRSASGQRPSPTLQPEQRRQQAAPVEASLAALSSPSVAVIIPTRNAGDDATRLCRALALQTRPPDEIVVIDSASDDGTAAIFRDYGATVLETDPERFRHGATRNRAARAATSDILVFMTQDVVPDPECLEHLIAPLAAGEAAASYGRQRPRPGAPPLESFAGERNYSEDSYAIDASSLEGAGVRAFFFSNACAAVRSDELWRQDGFPEQVIMNEDMNLAARLLRAGHRIAYRADAVVTHSHAYTPAELFRRYFDIGVALSQSEPELRNAATTGAGLNYVRAVIRHLLGIGRYDLLLRAALESGVKWLGHFLGRRHRRLPRWLTRRLSLHRAYWG